MKYVEWELPEGKPTLFGPVWGQQGGYVLSRAARHDDRAYRMVLRASSQMGIEAEGALVAFGAHWLPAPMSEEGSGLLVT